MKIKLDSRSRFIPLTLIAVYFVIFFVSISLGSVEINVLDTFKLLLSKLPIFSQIIDVSHISETTKTIILNIRLPRVILASIVGASLAVSGAVMQSVLKNPLADGSSLGVSSGASIGAVIAISAGLSFAFLPNLTIVFFSIIFALLSLVIVLGFVSKVDKNISGNTIILAGVIFSMLANSIVSLLIALFSDDTKKIIFWTLGSFSNSNYEKIFLILPFFLTGIFYILSKIPELNVMQIGEEQAGYIGVDTKKVKKGCLIVSSMLVGISVATSGNIGFVGLVIPYIARIMVKANHRYIIPFCVLFGSSFLVLTDMISRTIITPRELPIGTITSFVGAFLFVYIFYKSRKTKNLDEV